MSYADKALPTLWGRRLGLQEMSSGFSGSGRARGERPDFLVGAEDIRKNVTTAETTSINLRAYGYSKLPGTSAASSAVYTLDPPIPGVEKTIAGSSDNGPVFVKTANSETIESSLGSSFTTLKCSSVGGVIRLMGVTTATWAALNLTSGTSSQAGTWAATTST